MIAWLAMAMILSGAEAAAPLAPSGRWVVDYHPAMCVATHAFGTAGEVTVGLRPWPMGDRTEYVMVLPGKPGAPRRGSATVTLGGVGKPVTGEYVNWLMPKTTRRITVVTVDREATEHLEDATSIAIRLGTAPPVVVAPDRLKAALGALKTCNDDLLKTWGIDPTEGDRVATPAHAGNPANWITADDYPSAEFSNDIGGTVAITWRIETDGRVGDCRVVSTSGHPELDQAACKAVVQRGHYKPAIGLDGKPMATHSTRRVVWRPADF